MIHRANGWLAAVLAFGVLSWALLDLPGDPAGLAQEAYRSLEQSGVSNPVTAVLLNYRGYDTLLEIAVLLLAIVAVWSLRSVSTSSFAEPAGPMLAAGATVCFLIAERARLADVASIERTGP